MFFLRVNNVFKFGLDRDDPVFQEPYEILGGVPALFGGSEVLVGFQNSETLIAFWVPLEWTYPVIRAVYKRTEEQVLNESISSDEAE